jgi:hypothetical protein
LCAAICSFVCRVSTYSRDGLIGCIRLMSSFSMMFVRLPQTIASQQPYFTARTLFPGLTDILYQTQ